MKKILGIIALIFVLCSSAFAIDTVKVVRAGKATNTQTPIFSEITVASINYTYTGVVTANTLTDGTAKVVGGVGTGFSSITSTVFNGKLVATNTTSAATAATANLATVINVTVNGTLYKIPCY